MRARACINCKEYVIIHPNNPVSQNFVKQFELTHTRHNLIIVNLDEIRGIYQRDDNEAKSLERKPEISLVC
jgi:hypothetical protein